MLTLGEIATRVGAELRGDATVPVTGVPVTGVATLQNATAAQISFLSNPRYRKYLKTTRAAAVIVTEADAESCSVPVLISRNPYLCYARVAELFAPRFEPPPGIHPSAWVSPWARLGADVRIGPQCTVEDRAVLEAGVTVGPGCVIMTGAVVGEGTRLVANVTLCHGVRLGRRVLIHPGAVIGSDGFGLARDGGRWVKVPQLGGVRIGDDVEIGANTTIDRGALEDTVLEEGVKLDNLIQVAHNVTIGAHTAAAGCVGIAGSVRIGRHCTLAGGVGIAGHLELADHVHVTGMSLVTKSITEPGSYSSGLAVEPSTTWNRISSRLRRIDEMMRRLVALEKRCPPS